MKFRVLTAVSTALTIALSVSVAGLTVGGCGGGSSAPVAGATGMSMTIHWPATSRLLPDATQSVRVFVQDAAGFQTFRVANKPVGGGFSTVTFFGLTPGTLSVQATAFPAADAQGVALAEANTQVTLAQGANTQLSVALASTVSRIEVTPATKSVRPGNSAPLTATAKDKDGNILILSPAKTQWVSSDTTTVTVDTTGRVRGVKAGSATITFTDTESGKSGSALITVDSNAPATVDSVTISPATATIVVTGTRTLAPVLKDEAGNTLATAPGVWSTSDAAIATVDQLGKVTAVKAGSATITFAHTETGKTGTATITVKDPTLTSLTVTPSAPALTVGQTQALTLTFKDENGNAMAATPGTWESSAPTLASVDANGTITALQPTSSPVLITFTETATGKTASASVTISAAS